MKNENSVVRICFMADPAAPDVYVGSSIVPILWELYVIEAQRNFAFCCAETQEQKARLDAAQVASRKAREQRKTDRDRKAKLARA